MKIARTNMLTKTTSVMDIDITPEQLEEWWIGRQTRSGRLIQDIMPDISADEREFLISGITPDQWDETFGMIQDKFKNPKPMKQDKDNTNWGLMEDTGQCGWTQEG